MSAPILLLLVLLAAWQEPPARTEVTSASPAPPLARVPTRGRVTGGSGIAWPRAQVHLVGRFPRAVPHASFSDVVATSADEAGEFTANLLPGRVYHAWAYATGEDSRTRTTAVTAPILAGCPIAIGGESTLGPPFTLHVLGLGDWQDRAPFRVCVAGFELPIPASDPGRVPLPPLPADRFGVRLLDRNGGALALGSIALDPELRSAMIAWRKQRGMQVDEDPATVMLDVEPRATIELALHDHAGQPITRGVEVFISHEPQSPWEPLAPLLADGRWRFEAPVDWNEPSQWPEFLIRAPGCGDLYLAESDLRDQREGNVASAVLELPEGYVLKGRLALDAGTPLAGVPLLLYSSLASHGGGTYFGGGPIRALTAADGSFAIAGRGRRFGFRLTAAVDPSRFGASPALRDATPWPEVICGAQEAGPSSGDLDLGTIAVDALHVLDVLVRHEDGSAAALCDLAVSERSSGSKPELPDDQVVAVTGCDGRVRLLVPRPAQLALVARSPRGFGVAEVDIGAAEDGKATHSEVVITITSLSISGRVVDHEGRAIAGAVVYAYDHSNFQGSPTDTRADAQGRFVLPIPRPNREYALHAGCRVNGERFSTDDALDVRVHDDSVTDLEVVINTDPAAQRAKEARRAERQEPTYDATVKVEVTSRSDGKLLADIGVVINELGAGGWSGGEGPKGKLGEQVKTDAQGHCEIAVPSGRQLELRAQKEDESVGTLELAVDALTPGEVRQLPIALVTEYDLHFFGRVVADGDRAVPGATITLYETYMTEENDDWIEHERVFVSLKAGADGCFDVKLPSWRQLHGRAEADGFARGLFHPELGHDSRERARVIAMQEAASLEVRLVDAGHQPQANVMVALSTDPGETIVEAGGEWVDGSAMKWKAASDAEGRCSFTALTPQSPIAFELLRDGKRLPCRVDAVTLGPGEHRSLEIVLGSGTALRGVLLDQDGTPVAGHELWLLAAERAVRNVFDPYDGKRALAKTRSGPQGRFELEHVLPGEYWLGPAALRDHNDPPQSGLLAPVAELVRITEGADLPELTLRVQRGLYIRGRVLRADGSTPSSLVTVLGRCDGVPGMFQTWSHDGAFALGPLPAGPFTVYAMRDEGDADSAPVDTTAGDSDITLQLGEAGVVTGVLVDGATGQPIDGEVSLVSSDPESGNGEGASTTSGKFKADGVPPGSYTAFARSRTGLCGVARGIVVTGKKTTSDVRIVLEAGANVTVRCARTLAAAGVAWSLGNAMLGGERLTRDAPVTFLVPAGTITLTLYQWESESAEPKQEKRTITVAAGDRQEVAFD